MRRVAAVCAVSILPAFCGCIAVGYSSGGGWFVWPPLGLILLVLLVLLLARRR